MTIEESTERVLSTNDEVTTGEIDDAIGRGKIIYIDSDGRREERGWLDRELANKIRLHPVAISAITPQGYPNITPVSGVEVLEEGIIITNVHMNQTVRDLENMRKNGINHLTMAVWDDYRNGHKIRGQFTYSFSGEIVDFVRELPQNKSVSAKGAILIKPGLVIKCH